MTRVLCIGAAVVDFVFHLSDLPRAAEKFGTDDADVLVGGCAANAAVAISRLGGTAVLGARLGEDPVGDLIVSNLADDGVDVSHVTRNPGGRSSFSSVFLDDSGDRQIVNFRGAALVLRTDWFADQADLGAVLADTRRFDAALCALNLARERGIPGVLDGEAPVDPRLLAAASHVAFSMQGLRSIAPDAPIETALAEIATTHGCWACVTDGAEGVWYMSEDGIAHIPAFQIEPVDTLGAGDVWHGVFALALAEGAAEPEAIHMANAAAALKCMTGSVRRGAPTRERLTAFLRENAV